MPVILSPQYQDPTVGKIVSNLATAIYGDPEARMKRDYYGSEVQKNQADARKLGVEADRGQVSLDAYRNLPATLADLYGVRPGEDSVSRQNRIAAGLGSLAQSGAPTSSAADIAKVPGSALSSIYGSTGVATGNDDLIRGGLTLDGKMPGKDFAGTDKQAKVVADRDNTADLKKATSVANINQGGETFRAMHAPVKTGAGETVTLAPNDPRRGVNDTNGVITGLPNKATVEGAAGEKIMAGDNSPTISNLYYGTNPNAKIVQPGTGKPIRVTPKNVDDIEHAALNSFGAWDATTKGPLGDFASTMGLDARNRARAAAEHAYATHNGSSQAAIDAYREAIGVKPGEAWQSHGTIGSIFNGPSRFEAQPDAAPVAAASPAAPAPAAAAPAPVVTHAGQLPPPAQRQVGMTITTPKGDMTWTLQGWVPAAGKQY